MKLETVLLVAVVVGAAGTSAAAESRSSPHFGRGASGNTFMVAQSKPDEPKARSSESSRTVPGTTGQNQPQGPTGPINTTTTGGAPAESPQGETPPGMQSAPEGSSKTTVGPKQ